MDSSSAESKSLLDAEDDGKVVGDGTVAAGEAPDRAETGARSSTLAPTTAGSQSPAAATVITVDQATDTSLDNRYVFTSIYIVQ